MKRAFAFLALSVLGLCAVAIARATANGTSNIIIPIANLAICDAHTPNTADKTCIVDGDVRAVPELMSGLPRLQGTFIRRQQPVVLA